MGLARYINIRVVWRWPIPAILGVSLLGLILVSLPPLGALSYDFSFLFKPATTISNLVLVCSDNLTLRDYNDGNGNVSFSTHAKLLERLTADNPRLVLYDIFLGRTNQDKGLAAPLAS